MNSNIEELKNAAIELKDNGKPATIDRALLAVEACVNSGVSQYTSVKELISDVLDIVECYQDGFFNGRKEAMMKDLEYSLATLEAEDEGYVSVVDRMIRETKR